MMDIRDVGDHPDLWAIEVRPSSKGGADIVAVSTKREDLARAYSASYELVGGVVGLLGLPLTDFESDGSVMRALVFRT